MPPRSCSLPLLTAFGVRLLSLQVAGGLISMLLAGSVLRVIGENGSTILVRVMGMLLAALSAELLLTALGVPGWTTAG